MRLTLKAESTLGKGTRPIGFVSHSQTRITQTSSQNSPWTSKARLIISPQV